MPHDGAAIVWQDRPRFMIDTKKYTGKPMMVVRPDRHHRGTVLPRATRRRRIVEEAANVQLHELTSDRAQCDLREGRRAPALECDYSPAATGSMACQPQSHSGRCAQDLRAGLSVRLARHHVGDAALSGTSATLQQSRFCARVAAQPDAAPLLHPVQPRHADRGLAGRPVLGGISRRAFRKDMARQRS